MLELTKYIVFDFDGTLVDSMAIGIDIYNQIAKKYDFKEVKENDIEQLRKLSIMERISELKIPIYRIPFLAIEFHKVFKDAMNNIEFFAGIKDMLVKLDKLGYNLAIVSSNSAQNIRNFLAEEDINCIKEVFSSSNLFGKDKTIKKFLKENKLKESEIIYVGDEERDIVACKKLGVEIIWVAWGFDLVQVAIKEEPDYIVEQPKEIIELVRKLNQTD